MLMLFWLEPEGRQSGLLKHQQCIHKLTKEIPSHGQNSPDMLDSTKFTNNRFLCFLLLLIIHGGSSTTHNRSNLCNKTLVNLQPVIDPLHNETDKVVQQNERLALRGNYPEKVICVVAPKPHKFVNVFNCLRSNMRKEAKLNVTMSCLQVKLPTQK